MGRKDVYAIIVTYKLYHLKVNNMFRTMFLVFKCKNLSEQIASFQHDLLVYKTKEILGKENFFTECTFDLPQMDIFNSETVIAVSSAL